MRLHGCTVTRFHFCKNSTNTAAFTSRLCRFGYVDTVHITVHCSHVNALFAPQCTACAWPRQLNGSKPLLFMLAVVMPDCLKQAALSVVRATCCTLYKSCRFTWQASAAACCSPDKSCRLHMAGFCCSALHACDPVSCTTRGPGGQARCPDTGDGGPPAGG